jgi:hypothetical protein
MKDIGERERERERGMQCLMSVSPVPFYLLPLTMFFAHGVKRRKQMDYLWPFDAITQRRKLQTQQNAAFNKMK